MAGQRSGRHLKALHECVLGASGSGKTTYVMQELRRTKPKRLLVWDTKGEFAEEGYAATVATLGELLSLLAAAGKTAPFALAYRPAGDEKQMRAQFNLFCKFAYAAKGLTVVAEELADVTTASYAVEGWRRLSSQGRSEGVRIYGMSQQPASIDKHFYGNVAKVRTGRLNFDNHIRTVSNAIGVPASEVRDLLPMMWIEKDMNSGAISRGTIIYSKK